MKINTALMKVLFFLLVGGNSILYGGQSCASEDYNSAQNVTGKIESSIDFVNRILQKENNYCFKSDQEVEKFIVGLRESPGINSFKVTFLSYFKKYCCSINTTDNTTESQKNCCFHFSLEKTRYKDEENQDSFKKLVEESYDRPIFLKGVWTRCKGEFVTARKEFYSQLVSIAQGTFKGLNNGNIQFFLENFFLEEGEKLDLKIILIEESGRNFLAFQITDKEDKKTKGQETKNAKKAFSGQGKRVKLYITDQTTGEMINATQELLEQYQPVVEDLRKNVAEFLANRKNNKNDGQKNSNEDSSSYEDGNKEESHTYRWCAPLVYFGLMKHASDNQTEQECSSWFSGRHSWLAQWTRFAQCECFEKEEAASTTLRAIRLRRLRNLFVGAGCIAAGFFASRYFGYTKPFFLQKLHRFAFWNKK